MNFNANKECQIAKNAFEKYEYFTEVYIFTLVYKQRTEPLFASNAFCSCFILRLASINSAEKLQEISSCPENLRLPSPLQ
jgi:hypothetical protein